MTIPSWLSLSSKSGTGNKAINATAAVNKNASRSYVLTVTAGGITKTVNCVQKAANKFTLTLTCITFDSKGNIIQNVGKVSHGTDPTAGILKKGYYPDTSVQISAANNINGYHFNRWAENNTLLSTGNPLTLTVTKDRTIQGEYVINTYIVIAENEDDTKGSVSVTLNGAAIENNKVEFGKTVVFKATRHTGSKFVGWYDKTTGQLVSEAHIYNFVVNKALTLVAVWAAYYVSDTIKISLEGAGTVSPNPITGIEGTNISTKATANDGYIFDKWIYNTASSSTGFAESTNNPVGFTVTGSRDITAVFAKLHTISVKLGDATNITDSTGTIHTESYVVTRKHGTKFIIPSATKNSTVAYNYTFKHFIDNAGKTYAAGTEITVTSDLQLTPVFESKLNKYSYNFYNHTGATLIKTVTKDYGTTISSSEIPTAPTLSGYTFIGWFDTKSANGNKLNDNLTVKGNKTWYAVYEETKYKVTIVAVDGGRVEGDGFDSNGVLYAVPGTKVEIRAIPDAGNVFFKWNDQVTDAIRTITVGSSDIEYVAMFEVASLKLNVTQLIFDGNGGTEIVVVTANVNWTIS